jgi:hypothetical protein
MLISCLMFDQRFSYPHYIAAAKFMELCYPPTLLLAARRHHRQVLGSPQFDALPQSQHPLRAPL